MKFNKKFLSLLFALPFFFLCPAIVSAATLYFDPPKIEAGPNGVFEVKVKIGMGAEECFNAGEIVLDFPKDILEVKDFNSGESLLSLWIENPSAGDFLKANQAGRLSFSGGLPGGYCGKIPGDMGESNILGTVIFAVKNPILFHQGKINFSQETKILAADGQGTPLPAVFQGADISINEQKKETEDVWQKKISEDAIPPEPFVIQVSRDSRLAGGKYFAVFFTTDKQTGVDHYEALEARPEALSESKKYSDYLLRFFKKTPPPPQWEKVKSPYILKDQELGSILKIKAVDRAGNERLAEYSNADMIVKISRTAAQSLNLAILIFSSVIAVLIIFVLIIILKKRSRQ